MLKTLTIRNAALIEQAELRFSEGLNVLSGETGSGKSVILDCIDFVLGAKADRGLIRSGENECFVRAEFTSNGQINDILNELDIESDENLILSRKLTADGKGSLKINGNSVTAAMLRRITSLLVDVHGQSEHFLLLKESNQLRLLDNIAGKPVQEKKNAVHDLLSARKEILRELKIIGGDESERSRRLDVLRYQIKEISRAALKEGEEEELIALRNRFQNAEKILSGLNAARDFLLSDGGSIDALNGARRALTPIMKFEAACTDLTERLESAAAEVSDIADAVEALASGMEIDEREVERIETRIDEIKTLKKKYGGTVTEILKFQEQAEKEYELLSDSGERFEKLTAQLEEVDEKLFRACLELTAERKSTAEDFTKRVTAELKTLNIEAARFEIRFDEYSREDIPSATPEGLGGVQFLFSANAGEPLKELGKIISGGEMSRFMLAVKAQLPSSAIGTYLFDEIDAGIGGRTATVVAEKFCDISQRVQIIAVSHLARIAAFADREYLIEKQNVAGRAQTLIQEVTGPARISEIARMVSGDDGEFALKHAEELLKDAETYKNSLSRK